MRPLSRLCATIAALSLSPGLARAGCPATPAAVQADLDAAMAAYLAFDTTGFSARVAAIEADLGCLTEALDPSAAARLHLAGGLRAFVERDPAGTLSSFRGALAADPGLTLSDDLAPEGSRVRAAFDQARAEGPGGTAFLTVGPGLTLIVDGHRRVGDVPTERAALAQVLSADQGLSTWLLDREQPPPDLVSAAAGPGPPPPERTGHASRAVLLSGAAAGLASGLTLALAASTAGDYWDTDDRDAAEALYARNRALGFTGIGLGAAAVGLGASAVIVGKW